jgi:hypothetical protein
VERGLDCETGLQGEEGRELRALLAELRSRLDSGNA